MTTSIRLCKAVKLQAIIFDVDGTLAETEELHRQSFNMSFEQHKLDWHWDPELYAKLLQTTGGKERIAEYVATYKPGQADVLESLSALHRTKTRSYLDLLAKGALSLRPGVRRLIEEAQDRGVKLAIATTSRPENVLALLRSTLGTDSPERFVIAAGDTLGAKKPDPAVYLKALEVLAVEPDRAVAFEDSDNGLRAALAAGLRVVATPSLYLAGEEFLGASSVVSHLGEVDRPFTLIAGATFPRLFVDIDGLEALLDGSA